MLKKIIVFVFVFSLSAKFYAQKIYPLSFELYMLKVNFYVNNHLPSFLYDTLFIKNNAIKKLIYTKNTDTIQICYKRNGNIKKINNQNIIENDTLLFSNYFIPKRNKNICIYNILDCSKNDAELTYFEFDSLGHINSVFYYDTNNVECINYVENFNKIKFEKILETQQIYCNNKLFKRLFFIHPSNRSRFYEEIYDTLTSKLLSFADVFIDTNNNVFKYYEYIVSYPVDTVKNDDRVLCLNYFDEDTILYKTQYMHNFQMFFVYQKVNKLKYLKYVIAKYTDRGIEHTDTIQKYLYYKNMLLKSIEEIDPIIDTVKEKTEFEYEFYKFKKHQAIAKPVYEFFITYFY